MAKMKLRLSIPKFKEDDLDALPDLLRGIAGQLEEVLDDEHGPLEGTTGVSRGPGRRPLVAEWSIGP